MLQRVCRTIDRHRMFASGQKVGVAVSGGADSVALLAVLRELAPRFGLSLRVLHLDHGLRGEESHGDAEFVRELAASWGLPAVIETARMPAEGNLEEAARKARLGLFRRQMAGGAVDRVALGHTRSDQAETVLFRLLRGSGSAGLAAIRPVTASGLVRPLIDVERSEIRAWLRDRSLAWREDSSNRDPSFARNRIRHELLPKLSADWNPALEATLARTADWALAEESYWRAEIARLAEALFTRRGGSIVLRADRLAALPLAVARRLVRRSVEEVKGDLRGVDFEHIQAMVDLACASQGRGRVEARGVEAVRSLDWLRFAPSHLSRPAWRLPVSAPPCVVRPAPGLAISLELAENRDTFDKDDSVYNVRMDCLDWRSVSGPLELRSWLPGDRYHCAGCSGEEKLKTLFEKFRIPLWERWEWPVLTAGSTILWTRRFGPSMAAATGAASQIVLRIREIAPAKAEMESGLEDGASNGIGAK
ncbi:MAG: tRNA lysidine(34) synthetase TilS [Bryobacteraceae bacterium]